jgi:hypothetical protein
MWIYEESHELLFGLFHSSSLQLPVLVLKLYIVHSCLSYPIAKTITTQYLKHLNNRKPFKNAVLQACIIYLSTEAGNPSLTCGSLAGSSQGQLQRERERTD